MRRPLAVSRIKPDKEELIPVPGGRVYVRINGNIAGPRPPIVLLHGGPGSSHWYLLNATALADERAVNLYDQLDGGRSEHPNHPINWQLARFASELEAITKRTGIIVGDARPDVAAVSLAAGRSSIEAEFEAIGSSVVMA